MNKEEFIKAITEAINAMDSSELFVLNNRFCDSANYPDNQIYENDSEFFSLFGSVEDFAKCVTRDYNCYHGFVTYDGCGNLESFDRITIDKLVDCPHAMAGYIFENWDDFSDLFNLDFEEEEDNV